MTSGRPTGLRLAVVPGDGIGPEVVAEGLRVLDDPNREELRWLRRP